MNKRKCLPVLGQFHVTQLGTGFRLVTGFSLVMCGVVSPVGSWAINIVTELANILFPTSVDIGCVCRYA